MEETDVDEALANTYAAIEIFNGVALPADQYAEAFHRWRTGKLPPAVIRGVDVIDSSLEEEEIVFTPLFEKGVVGFAAGGLPIPAEAVETLRQLVRWPEPEYRIGVVFAPQRVAAATWLTVSILGL